MYDKLKKKMGTYELYNLLEKSLIEVELTEQDKKRLEDMNLE